MSITDKSASILPRIGSKTTCDSHGFDFRFWHTSDSQWALILLPLDAGVVNDRYPAFEVRPNQATKFRRLIGDRRHTLLVEQTGDFRIGPPCSPRRGASWHCGGVGDVLID